MSVLNSAIGQETQLAVLETTERALYTVQSIRKVLHYDALQKEPESYGSVWKLREAGRMHRPELDGTKQKGVEYAGNYSIVQGLGSVIPYSYPCRHVRASDLWCRRQSDVTLHMHCGLFRCGGLLGIFCSLADIWIRSATFVVLCVFSRHFDSAFIIGRGSTAM